MKVQLSKTKTIEIGRPSSGGDARAGQGLADVTGVEMFSGDPRGCPAVRLTCRKGVWGVQAVGFVDPPGGALPEKWEETTHQPSWALPAEFQAPNAALAVTSPDMFIRQTSTKPRKPGVPVSDQGTRSVAIALADDGSAVECGLPEFQALWLSRLLPEGKRPTACSIQLAPAAALSSIRRQPEFIAADGNAMLVYVGRSAVYFAGFREGQPILFRQCPGISGWTAMREAAKAALGLDDEIVDSVLDDTLIDPRPVLEPFVRPVLDQLELSLGYLSSRHALRLTKVFLAGLPSGAHYWSQISADALRLPLAAPSAFEGLQAPAGRGRAGNGTGLSAAQSQTYLVALGAALAAMEAGA